MRRFTRISLIPIILIFLSQTLGLPVFSEGTGSPSHVIINQVYGGGDLNDSETPVSHSFIELYNPTEEDVDINGWSLQYAQTGTNWRVMSLKGSIKAHSSFLVRCGAHNAAARLKIDKFDMSWGIPINNKGVKVLLKSNSQPCIAANPYYDDTNGYVDMIGAAGNEFHYLVDGCETDYAQIQSKQKSIRRKRFQDTDNNAADVVAIDYRTVDLEAVRPRCAADGAWEYTEFKRTKEINITPLEDSGKEEFSFLHVSDTQASTAGQFEQWGALAAALGGEDYDFTLHTGDICDNTNNVEEMDMFYENTADLCKKPFMAVIGNHDKKSAQLFKRYLGALPGVEAPLPAEPGTTASFDYGNAHFIILNSESDLSSQAAWLDEELGKTDKKWKIVALHRSPYGAVGMNDTMVFAKIFDKHHVDLVLHGHDHLYLRTYPLYNGQISEGGTVYLESGSSGVKQEGALVKQDYQEISISPLSPTYSKITVSDSEISVTSKTLDGSQLREIDSFSIKKYHGEYDEVCEVEYDNVVRDFSDIRSDRTFYDAVMLLAQLNIIETTSSFMPDAAISRRELYEWLNSAGALGIESSDEGTISPDEAIRLAVDSLGYKKYIEISNQSYDYVAEDIGLTKGMEHCPKDALTRGYGAQLVKNALEAYIVKLTGTDKGSAQYAQVYENWLGNIHNVYKSRGIIIDRPYYKNASGNTVTFVNEYGEEITCRSTDTVYPLLGYETDAYIRSDSDGNEMIYGIKTNNNKELKVKKSWYGDIASVGKYINFEYTDLDINKKYTVKIDTDAEFVYNGARSETIKTKALRAEHNAFKPSHIGKITLTDYNGDNVYDFVFIDNYKDIVVDGIDDSQKKITNKLSYDEELSVKPSKYTEIPEICLDESDPAYKVSFFAPDEKPSSFSAITKNSIVSVALSSTDDEDPQSALVRRVYISNNSTVGEITRIYEEDEDDYFVINGKSYRPSKSYYNTFNGGESVDFSNLNVGDYVSLYLDYDDRFSWVATDGLMNEEMYGILLSWEYDKNIDVVYMKIVGEDGNTKTYTMTPKLFDSNHLAQTSSPELMKFKIYGTTVKKAERVKLESSGNMTYLSDSGRMGNYFLDDSVKVFLYKGTKNDEHITDKYYYDTAKSSYLKDKYTYITDVFNVENYYLPAAILVYCQSNRETSDDDGIMYVKSLKSILNADNESVSAACCYINGEEKQVEFSQDLDLLPMAGDIIQYRTDPDGAIEMWKKLCASDSEPFETNTVFDDAFFAKYDSITGVDKGVLTVRIGNEYKNYKADKDTRVYCITEGEKSSELSAGSYDGIVRGDRLFIVSREGKTDEIYVWKNY